MSKRGTVELVLISFYPVPAIEFFTKKFCKFKSYIYFCTRNEGDCPALMENSSLAQLVRAPDC